MRVARDLTRERLAAKAREGIENEYHLHYHKRCVPTMSS